MYCFGDRILDILITLREPTVLFRRQCGVPRCRPQGQQWEKNQHNGRMLILSKTTTVVFDGLLWEYDNDINLCIFVYIYIQYTYQYYNIYILINGCVGTHGDKLWFYNVLSLCGVTLNLVVYHCVSNKQYSDAHENRWQVDDECLNMFPAFQLSEWFWIQVDHPPAMEISSAICSFCSIHPLL